MSRRVVILQRKNERLAVLAAKLIERGYSVVVARSETEALRLVEDACMTLVVDGPDLGREDSVCRYVQDQVRPMPMIVAILAKGQPFPSANTEHVKVLPARTDMNEVVGIVVGASSWWPGDI
jgi:hypothetical protein